MTERRTITVDVHTWYDDFDQPVADFIGQLEGLLNEVPHEFRDAVALSFEQYGSDYDTSRGELKLYYRREETDEELRARTRDETYSKNAAEDRERKQLAALKAKYE